MDTQRDMVETQGDIPGLSVSSEYPGYPRIPRHRVYGGATGEYPGTVWYRPSIPGILGYQDTGYMVETQGEYPGTVWYRPSIPGILGYQDTGYMVEPQGEYPGTVWYRPSIPGILGYQDTGYMVEPQGEYPGTVWYRPSIPGILGYQDTGYMVEPQGEYSGTVWYRPSILYHTLGYQDTWREIPGLTGTVLVSQVYVVPKRREIPGQSGTVLVSRVYVVPKHNGDCASSPDIQGSTRTVLGSTGHVCSREQSVHNGKLLSKQKELIVKAW